MNRLLFSIMLVFTGLLACKTPEIVVDPSLTAEPMNVKGRNGFQIGQVIRYGAYATSKVRRGWTKTYEVPFVVTFRGAKEKLSFTQYSPNGTAAEVACISRFKSVELPLLKDYFSIPLEMQNFFAGNIVFGNGQSNWDFILYNPNGDFLRDQASAGYIQNGSVKIDIRAIRGLQGQPDWLKELTIYGHEFLLNGKVVGAVSTINKGQVRIDPTLDEETGTVIAAVATGILLRRDVEQAADSPVGKK